MLDPTATAVDRPAAQRPALARWGVVRERAGAGDEDLPRDGVEALGGRVGVDVRGLGVLDGGVLDGGVLHPGEVGERRPETAFAQFAAVLERDGHIDVLEAGVGRSAPRRAVARWAVKGAGYLGGDGDVLEDRLDAVVPIAESLALIVGGAHTDVSGARRFNRRRARRLIRPSSERVNMGASTSRATQHDGIDTDEDPPRTPAELREAPIEPRTLAIDLDTDAWLAVLGLAEEPAGSVEFDNGATVAEWYDCPEDADVVLCVEETAIDEKPDTFDGFDDLEAAVDAGRLLLRAVPEPRVVPVLEEFIEARAAGEWDGLRPYIRRRLDR